MSFVLPELRRPPWELDEWQLGRLVTTIGCGSIFGETLFGALADRYGRRTVFMFTVLLVFGFGVLSSFAPTVHWLAALRFCVGFGYGGNIAVDFTMYSEFLPTQGRGRMMFLLAGFWPVGQILAALMAWYIIPVLGWRAFVVACAIPSLITAFARPFIPESPRWLLTKGRVQEATQVCLEIAELNGKPPESVGLGHGCEVCLENENSSLESASVARDPESYKIPLAHLFNKSLVHTTVGLLLMVSALNYVSYGTLTLMPTFLEMKGIPKASMYLSMVFNSMAQLPGIALGAAGALYIGRLHSIRASMFLTGLGLFAFAFVNKQQHVVACTMFASCFLEASWSLYHVYVPEVYPTDCRAFATGFLSAAGSIVAIAGPFVSAWLMENAKSPINVILAISGTAGLAGIGACTLLQIETKDRDLHDVSVKGSTAKTVP